MILLEPTAMFPALWSTLINDVLTLYYRRKEVMILLEPTAMFPARWCMLCLSMMCSPFITGGRR